MRRRTFTCLVLALCASLAAQEMSDAGLDSPDENVRIQALVTLAAAGEKARPHEKAITAQLTKDWRGKRLSRWSMMALQSISANPGQYLDAYIDSAGWLHYNVVEVGQEGVVGGPQPAREGPKLPQELEHASTKAWEICVPLVVIELKSTKPERRRAVQECLEKMEALASILVPQLATLLQDAKLPVDVRVASAEVIGFYGPFAGSVDVLLLGLKDTDPKLRQQCAVAIGRLGTAYEPYGGSNGKPKHPRADAAIQSLTQLLENDPVGTVRRCAATGLGEMCDEARPAVPALINAALKDTDKIVRYGAIYALSQACAPAAIPAMCSALSDPDRDVRREAASSLGSLISKLRRDAPAALDEQAKQAIPVLIKALSGDPGVSAAAAQSLGQFGPSAKDAVPHLHKIVRESSNKDLVGRAIYGLGYIGPAAKDAVPDIIAAGKKADHAFGIAIALGGIGEGSNETETALVGLLQSNENYVRRTAAESLGKVAVAKGAAIDALTKAGEVDNDSDVKKACKEAILKIRARAGTNPNAEF